ncbi:MAG: F0F1 ATP synthase subunit A [Cytophagales bacterium]|nr:F0F1 ATP synthase subunit A [Armatimonadota bacterium]
MPQNGTLSGVHKNIQLAQETGSPVAAAEGNSGGETHATVGHGGGHSEGPPNPLAEYPALYYSLVAGLVFLTIAGIAFFTTRGLNRRTPSRKQAFIEQCVASITHFSRAAIGEGGEKFAPLVGTVFAFVLISNLMGVLPFVFNSPHGEGLASLLPAPTANLSMTIAVSLVVFLVVQAVGIKENGLGGYLKHFAGPVWWLSWLIFPIEFIGALVKPISLSIRLFGNVFGEETVIAVLVGLAVSALPAFLPIPFQFPMLVFGVFGSIVQAGVYTILTCAYIALSIGEHDSHGGHHEVDEFGAQVPGAIPAGAIANQAH